MSELTMVEALNLAMRQEMARDEDVMLLGEDVGRDGGIFRVSEGLLEAYGEDRVIDTPLAESGIVGFSIGMAMYGLKPICELQFSGFSYFAFHQIESHAARLRWRSRGRFSVPMVMRMPYGGGVRALEHHSESRETYFTHTPGLKVVVPSSPRLARALLVSAIRDPDPVVYLEPKALYRAFREEVPDEEETYPLDRARLVREGSDLSIIAYGAMLPRVLRAATRLSDEDGISVDVLDLVSLAPLDEQAIHRSVQKSGRAVVVHEAPRRFGPAGEIIACIAELGGDIGPVARVTGFDVPMPFFAREQDYLPDAARIVAAARQTLHA